MPLEVPIATRTIYHFKGTRLSENPALTILPAGESWTAWEDQTHDPDMQDFSNGVNLIIASSDPPATPGFATGIAVSFDMASGFDMSVYRSQDWVFEDNSSVSLRVFKQMETGHAREMEDQILHVDIMDDLNLDPFADDGVTTAVNPNNPWSISARTRVADFLHVHVDWNVQVTIPLTFTDVVVDRVNTVLRRSSGTARLGFLISTESVNGPTPDATFAIANPTSVIIPEEQVPALVWSVPILGTEDVLQGKVGTDQASSRWDRCPKCGFYTLRETWVQDGYREGLLVCPKCWEPEDREPRDLAPETEPVGEDG